ncbi:hypothetical protein N4G70_13075 [Streptomyces sp. ASQP_92]|uniref:hypothetical protein n=1 Tax=Streptomyces sp. ASQP_92 TaxID=2979116 RepID=UPI0021BE8707|nr:hypothetical protein [Streptomyces sp. ASQP_92]MCT9089794.1 hypothetical protein [Streptomyces sp. ASQP_92]
MCDTGIHRSAFKAPPRGTRGRRTSRLTLIGAALCLLGSTSACGLLPEHPAADKALTLGLRVTGSRIEVKVPLCPGKRVSHVEVWKPSDGKGGERLLWWGTGPSAPRQGASAGVIPLWSAVGYASASSAPRPSTLLPQIDISVDYAGEHDGVGGILDTRQASNSGLKPGQYWTTRDSSMTGKEIDDHLRCHQYSSPAAERP